MDRLQQVSVKGGQVEGAYTERQQLTYFTIPSEKLRDPAARTEGYKQAIERIIAYMAPGAVADIEANRIYMKQLRAKLISIAGVEFATYTEWKNWFDTNRDRLKWSDAKNMLVLED
jgi:hypothetical protein